MNRTSRPIGTVQPADTRVLKGRGATFSPGGRFEGFEREIFDDGWERTEEEVPGRTTVMPEHVRSIVSSNESPDIPFTYSINPYRGCEHGCVYCYARPTHAYLNLSPGLDFETKLFAKVNAVERLREFLARENYRCESITLGANTDPYQPVERHWNITRGILQVLHDHDHPVTIITKNALVERDLDLLVPMAQKNLVQVFISITTLDHDIARRMEPRAVSPARRVRAIAALTAAGVPCGVLVAPVVPFLTDAGVEQVLDAAAAAGATRAGYVLLRLPLEVKDLFRAWLDQHFPLKAAHVMSRVHAMREGRDNDPQFGSRMKGSGILADLLKKRFDAACRRLHLNRERKSLDTTRFLRPRLDGQLDLF
jgi:DNA repair photolyase